MPQRHGRGIRKKTDGPNLFFLIDFKDTNTRSLGGQFKERERFYKSLPGARIYYDREIGDIEGEVVPG